MPGIQSASTTWYLTGSPEWHPSHLAYSHPVVHVCVRPDIAMGTYTCNLISACSGPPVFVLIMHKRSPDHRTTHPHPRPPRTRADRYISQPILGLGSLSWVRVPFLGQGLGPLQLTSGTRKQTQTQARPDPDPPADLYPDPYNLPASACDCSTVFSQLGA